MKHTQTQIKQLLLQTLLSDVGIYNIAEVSRRSGVHYQATKKHLPEMFGKIKRGEFWFYFKQSEVPIKDRKEFDKWKDKMMTCFHFPSTKKEEL